MNIKKAISILSIILIVIILFPTVTTFATEEKNKEKIKIGYNHGDELIENIEHKRHEGYGYEVLKKIEEVSDLEFEFVEIHGNLFDALESGKVDIIGLVFKTPEREEKFLYLDTPFNAANVTLMSKREDDLIYANPSQIDGKTVATYEGNIGDQYLNKFLEENNISVEYKVGDFYDYMEIDADLYLRFSSDADIDGFEALLNLSKHQSYLVSNYGNQDIMEEINAAMNFIVINEGDYFEELQQKYFKGTFYAFHRDLTVKELELLRSRPLKVAYEINHEPYTFQNNQGNPDGAVVDLLNQLVELYNFTVEYYPYSLDEPSSFPSDCDMVISVIGDVDHYSQHFTPTESYYSMQMLGLVPAQVAENSNTSEEIRLVSKKIGVLKYLNSNFDLFLESSPENEYVFFSSFTDLLHAYDNEEIDLAVFTEPGLGFANSYLDSTHNYSYSTDFILDYHFGIENSIAEDYVPLFNVMLDNISSQEYEEILIANTSHFFYEETTWDFITKNATSFLLVIILVILFFIGYGYIQQKKKKEAINYAYNTDSLTGLIAEHKFIEYMDKKIPELNANEYELISMDIDMFRTINTHYSPQAGTDVIKALANALKDAFSTSDTQITRVTADRFLVFRKINEGGTLDYIFTSILSPAAKTVIGEKYNFVMSFGSVAISEATTSASIYVGQADLARNKGKDDHNTTFYKFTKKMKKSYENKVNVTIHMEEAMKNKEFLVVYQPKIDLHTMKVGGAEALVRWQRPSGNFIYPDEFIPIFEDNGFIASIDLFVLNEVCSCIIESKETLPLTRISVNISAKTMLHSDIVAKIKHIVTLNSIDPNIIELEITESAIVEDEKDVLTKIKELKMLGFHIAIDDFGAGVSSLHRLNKMNVDVLKLDKSFFNESEPDLRSSLIIQDLIVMAKHLNMKVVAEGIEICKQASWLKDINCDYIQGYYFEKPMSKDSFKELLLENKIYTLD